MAGDTRLSGEARMQAAEALARVRWKSSAVPQLRSGEPILDVVHLGGQAVARADWDVRVLLDWQDWGVGAYLIRSTSDVDLTSFRAWAAKLLALVGREAGMALLAWLVDNSTFHTVIRMQAVEALFIRDREAGTAALARLVDDTTVLDSTRMRLAKFLARIDQKPGGHGGVR
ncbi:hypothetical protein ACIRJS_27460 [Streptomyces sp. NPDC102340]|uniref:hypothetical protein n=1 Tax=unclassified Streptomyces TaxID=2593676 RepID=UPI00382D41A8